MSYFLLSTGTPCTLPMQCTPGVLNPCQALPHPPQSSTYTLPHALNLTLLISICCILSSSTSSPSSRPNKALKYYSSSTTTQPFSTAFQRLQVLTAVNCNKQSELGVTKSFVQVHEHADLHIHSYPEIHTALSFYSDIPPSY